MVAQRTLTECAASSTECADDTPTTERNLLDRAQAHAADVAAAHFSDLPIDAIAWEVSQRRQRSAGATNNDLARMGCIRATRLGTIQFDRVP